MYQIITVLCSDLNFQGWVLVMSNASFALGVATEIIRILFLSGYGMVNFVFGMAVYFSALFYLVNNSCNFVRI